MDSEAEAIPDDRMITLDDYRARQGAFLAVTDDAVLNMWITHVDGCGACSAEPCNCDLVAWFSTPGNVFGVDGSLAVHKFPLH